MMPNTEPAPDLDHLDAWLAAREGSVPGLRAGVHKRVHWAGAKGQRSPVSVVYIHGFSATSEEIRPVPDLVAKALGANLFFTRLTGHGCDGAAMGEATLVDWVRDAQQAFALGHMLGEKVLVMACSTGCTLATLAHGMGAEADMLHFTSPNFGMAFAPLQWLISRPGARDWGPRVIGREAGPGPANEAHSAYWTPRYDSRAVFTMGEAVRAALDLDAGSFTAPLVTHLCKADRVVSARAAERVMARWGAQTRLHHLPKGRDPNGHLLAGDVFNPGHNDRVVADVLAAWDGFS